MMNFFLSDIISDVTSWLFLEKSYLFTFQEKMQSWLLLSIESTRIYWIEQVRQTITMLEFQCLTNIVLCRQAESCLNPFCWVWSLGSWRAQEEGDSSWIHAGCCLWRHCRTHLNPYSGHPPTAVRMPSRSREVLEVEGNLFTLILSLNSIQWWVEESEPERCVDVRRLLDRSNCWHNRLRWNWNGCR